MSGTEAAGVTAAGHLHIPGHPTSLSIVSDGDEAMFVTEGADE